MKLSKWQDYNWGPSEQAIHHSLFIKLNCSERSWRLNCATNVTLLPEQLGQIKKIALVKKQMAEQVLKSSIKLQDMNLVIVDIP